MSSINDIFAANIYRPDVLSCLANLSSDEVFTPPSIVNDILDLLPAKLWTNPNATFLDPVCKSGVFLREIAKRLNKGLEKKIPDLQERIDHIFQKQLFGIAITELTARLSRRTLYCSRRANSRWSVTPFANLDGNIRFQTVFHTWERGKCKYCGAPQEIFDRDPSLETHAYEFIHTPNAENIFKMKFDVIIGNPPYQMNDGGNGRSAKPIYHHFIEQAKKLNPHYITMIIPSRWLNGGKGLNTFRSSMLDDSHITQFVDFQNAKDCFPGVSIGSVCYFLWERDKTADCLFTNVIGQQRISLKRKLNEFPVFVRYNDAVNIIKKVRAIDSESIVQVMSSRNPFGIPTNEHGEQNKMRSSLTLYSSQGTSYIKKENVTQGQQYINNYKVMISRTTSEHAGEPDSSGQYKVIANIKLLKPKEICTDSYIIGYPTDNADKSLNFFSYLKTKFVRFLLLQALSSINLSKEVYSFVPMQDFTENWTDEKLYAKYGLTGDEIAFIESMIKPMDSNEEGE